MKSHPLFLPRLLVAIFLLTASISMAIADGPADNQIESIRPVPPAGIEIPAEIRESLNQALVPLKTTIDELSQSKDSRIQNQLPDAEIFYRAVSLALAENGFFDPADFDRAKELIEEGKRRCEAIRSNSCNWTLLGNAPITVRGFRSKLDGTVQPYGVVFQSSPSAIPFSGRADVWCRGRSEKGLELQFLSTRMKNPDPLPDAGVLMIHPFGRYCNANKLAGEVDTLEALEHAMTQYQIDPKRIAIRGFSMGGAAAWHLAVHYPDRWFAATPGAGFSETPDFLKVFQSETLKPYWFEQKLWTMHDCPVWVRNLQTVPTIAYSGEIDKQKQAADIMAKASWELPDDQRFELTHIVAPKTAHSISPDAKKEIDRRLRILDPAANLLSNRKIKREDNIAFTTTTLRYNRAFWVTVDALSNHHEPATISARFNYPEHIYDSNNITIGIEGGITQFTLDRDVSQLGDDLIQIRIQDSENAVAKETFEIKPRSDGSLKATFRIHQGFWDLVSPIEPPPTHLLKKHLLQGPIDDALMAPFLFVKPTAKGLNPKIDQWIQSELDHAITQWHKQMRGDVRIKSSDELTPADFQNYHLILWGDPKSNPTIAKVLETDGIAKLPLQWTDKKIELGSLSLDAENHIPLLIYPNPLAPDRYVVFNSSFTYREYDYLNNARQVPKLPDWAMIDVNTPPNGRWPGKIVQADFFDEAWKVKPTLKPIDPK